jgi:murein DD-endopeptidase MepM/ murein hydrolase activator NlpD
MMSLAQNDRKKVFDLWGVGGAVLLQSEVQTDNAMDLPEKNSELALRMKKLDQDFRTTKGVIGKMNEYIATQKEVFDKLPILWPIPEGGYVSSEFGWREHPLRKRREFHLGLDIAIYAGAPIVATADGDVLSAGFNSELGYYVIVQHAYGFSTRYAHCSRIKVAPGQHVRRGQTIAYVGNSGLATGYHLHYEVRIGNTAVDPWPYIIRMK